MSGPEPATATDEHTSPNGENGSTGQLVARLSQEVSDLIRSELQLAQVEVSTKAKGLGVGAGMLSGAGVVALFALGAFTASAILGLSLVMDAWLAALVVGVALLAVAGLVGLLGKKRVSEAAPPVPTEAIESVKQDIAVLKKGGNA